MSKSKDKKPDKPKKTKPKSGRDAAEMRKQCVLQDLKAGFRPSVVADRNGLSRDYVRKIALDNKDELKADMEEQLKKRQERINTFLEKHNADLMDILEEAGSILKKSLKRFSDKLADPSNVIPVELRTKDEKGRFIKAVPADDILRAMEVWKSAQSVFAAFQRIGEE